MQQQRGCPDRYAQSGKTRVKSASRRVELVRVGLESKESRLGLIASRSRASPKRHPRCNVHQLVTASDGRPTLCLHFHTDCGPQLSPPSFGTRAQSTHVRLGRKLKPFCSPDVAPSCAHYQQNQTCPVHQKINRPTFRKTDILFTGNLTPRSGFTRG